MKLLGGKLAHLRRTRPVNGAGLIGAKMNQPDIKIRKASSADVEAIMKSLEALSCEIPVKMNTEESQQALRKIVAECCEQSSWVALDKADHLVGFQLSKKCDDGFELPYGGVLPAYRKQGLFRRHLSKAKELKRPLRVAVSHANRDMAAILAKEGFTNDGCYPNKEDFALEAAKKITKPNCLIGQFLQD
jgi:hypothetical protein